MQRLAISPEAFQIHSPSPRSYSPTISVPPVTPLIAHCISGLFSWRVDYEHSPARSGSPIHICLLVQEFPGPLRRGADRPGNCFFLLSRSHLFGIPLFCALGAQQECCQLSGLRELSGCGMVSGERLKKSNPRWGRGQTPRTAAPCCGSKWLTQSRRFAFEPS